MSGIIGGAGSKSGIIGQTELDYEEGTFTATMGGGNPPSTPPTTTGQYTKIGRQVTVTFNYESVNCSGGSGGVQITGMPFACADMPSFTLGMYFGTVNSKNFNYTVGTNVQPYINETTTVIQFTTTGDSAVIGGFEYISGSDRYLRVSCTYFA